MAINKVIKKGVVELDLTSDTVTPETLMQGVTSHDAKGETIQGTFTIDSELTTQDNLISQIQTALQNKAAGSEPVLQDKIITPSTSIQEVKPDTGYDGLSQVTVNAIPSTYVKPTATKSATTYTPSTSNQTIAAGTYCSGAQTIKGDSNLVAGNIKSGVSIFGVTGTHSGGSGGNIKTCNVTITSSVISTADALLFTTYDGTDVTASYYPSSSLPVTVENVLCGSGFHLNVSPYLAFPGFNVTNGSIERKHMQLFRLVAESGAEVTINIYNND